MIITRYLEQRETAVCSGWMWQLLLTVPPLPYPSLDSLLSENSLCFLCSLSGDYKNSRERIAAYCLQKHLTFRLGELLEKCLAWQVWPLAAELQFWKSVMTFSHTDQGTKGFFQGLFIFKDKTPTHVHAHARASSQQPMWSLKIMVWLSPNAHDFLAMFLFPNTMLPLKCIG